MIRAQEKTDHQFGLLFVKQEDDMTDKKEPLKVVFEPGCFDSFEGTQEELESFMAEIQDMFANLTPEELKARSRAIDLNDLDEDELKMLAHAMFSEEELKEMGVPKLERKLQ